MLCPFGNFLWKFGNFLCPFGNRALEIWKLSVSLWKSLWKMLPGVRCATPGFVVGLLRSKPDN